LRVFCLFLIKKTKYKASGGIEIFLQAVNKNNILFGLCRLRIDKKHAIIRELHVYGSSLKLGKKHPEKYQHKGLGKALLKKAEKIAKKHKIKKLKIISGAGVREYYRKFNYKLDDSRIYMEKQL
jgi:elongator complex protein 3